MDEEFVIKIREHAAAQVRGVPFPPAPEIAVVEAEGRLGFPIPTLLKLVYTKVGNGGFGPGRGGTIIGLTGGYKSDFGDLVETYEQLKRDQESQGMKWKAGLLPFCEWGCNIFSCVHAIEAQHPIYLFEDLRVRAQNYSLRDFFKMWLEGVDILSWDGTRTESVEVTNPFTGKKARLWKRQEK